MTTAVPDAVPAQAEHSSKAVVLGSAQGPVPLFWRGTALQCSHAGACAWLPPQGERTGISSNHACNTRGNHVDTRQESGFGSTAERRQESTGPTHLSLRLHISILNLNIRNSSDILNTLVFAVLAEVLVLAASCAPKSRTAGVQLLACWLVLLTSCWTPFCVCCSARVGAVAGVSRAAELLMSGPQHLCRMQMVH